MNDKNLGAQDKKSIQIYIISCCFNDRLERMEIAFSKTKAIRIWEDFTGQDYKQYLKQQQNNIYDYSETAGTKINEFEINIAEILDLL